MRFRSGWRESVDRRPVDSRRPVVSREWCVVRVWCRCGCGCGLRLPFLAQVVVGALVRAPALFGPRPEREKEAAVAP